MATDNQAPKNYQLEELLEIMARLRDPDTGCPWDKKQSYASVVPSTIEEAYEVADTIERGDLQHLKEELGDLLFQVVFYSQLGKEDGLFDFNSVVAALSSKLVERHPHVFIDTAGEVLEETAIKGNWEARKSKERAAKGLNSVLADVPLGLPSMTRAQKLQKRAANVGFDWPNTQSVMGKVEEEKAELEEALLDQNPDAIEEELGDLMFCLVNLSRHLKLDAESVLRKANQKFERRFCDVEASVNQSEQSWSDHSPSQLEEYWQQAKRKEKAT